MIYLLVLLVVGALALATSLTHTLQSQWSNGTGAPLSGSNAVAVDGECNESFTVSQAVAAGVLKKNMPYSAAGLRDVFILVTGLTAGQTVELKTYAEEKASQGSALDTLIITQGVPISWVTGQGTCPLQTTTAVGSIKVTNLNSASVAQFDARLGFNG